MEDDDGSGQAAEGVELGEAVNFVKLDFVDGDGVRGRRRHLRIIGRWGG
jgi:hypothetical protein